MIGTGVEEFLRYMELPHSLYSVIVETPFCKADKNAYPYNIAMSFNLDPESAKEAIWI